jgi:hypothetical protein
MDLFEHAVRRDYGDATIEQEVAVSGSAPDPSLAKNKAQEADAWIHTPGGRRLMRHIYQTAAYYGERYRRTGRMVSGRLIFELVRDRLPVLRVRMDRDGVPFKKYKGFALNNDFVPYVTDHIVSRRPEWDGMFENRSRPSAHKPIREMS